MARDLPKGIRLTGTGYQAYLRVEGRFYSQRYPLGTALKEMKDWREDKRVSVRNRVVLPTIADTELGFASDVRTYFTIVRTMPSLSDRLFHLKQWTKVFGRRPRSTITAQMIRAQLETWLAQGFAPASCNRRRTALMSLWTTLDGKSAANPVRDVPRYDEGTGELRALSHRIIYRIFACMHKSVRRFQESKGRGTRYHSAVTLARLRVLAWTGWPHKQIGHLKPEHLQLSKGRAYVTPRRKGKGTKGEWLPLLPPAITALREFDRLGAYGPFSHSSMHAAFRRALAQYNAHRARFGHRPISANPYALRHSFGVFVAALFKDDSIVQRLMLHSSPEQTQRYIRAARAYRLDTAMATLATSEGFSGVLKGLREIGETGRESEKQWRARQDSNLRPPA